MHSLNKRNTTKEEEAYLQRVNKRNQGPGEKTNKRVNLVRIKNIDLKIYNNFHLAQSIKLYFFIDDQSININAEKLYTKII